MLGIIFCLAFILAILTIKQGEGNERGKCGCASRAKKGN